MPRVNKVEKAAKDQPDHGIKKGDTYYWWKFRFGGKRVSKTFPKASQLTQSEYLSEIYSIHEDFADTEDGDLRDAIPDLVDRIRECGEGCQERLDNMPEGLQQGSTGEMLQERIDCCESAADELEGLDFEELSDEELRDEVDSILGGLE